MNKTQRATIQAAQETFQGAVENFSSLMAGEFEGLDWNEVKDAATKLRDEVDALASTYEDIGNEEQEKYDNLSEGLQQSEKGQTLESNASTFTDAFYSADPLRDFTEEFLKKDKPTTEEEFEALVEEWQVVESDFEDFGTVEGE